MIAIATEAITKAEKSSQIRIVEGDALDMYLSKFRDHR